MGPGGAAGDGAPRARARLCLNMIVKDEAAIVERSIASIAPFVDWYVVCDTGSNDDTRERVAAAFAVHGVEGEIHAIAFGDFGRARNRALEIARASQAEFDYLLFADADMELEVVDADFRALLDAPAYRVRQHNGYAYWNVRLLRRDVEARYVGATHEYLALVGAPARLDAIAFADHASGSSRATKLERDIALLSAALEADPGDVRAMFYLAQTCRDAGRHDEARAWYRKRIDAGGWDEETWYALFMHARSSLALGDDVGFVDGCLSAYEFRPSRAEPIAALVSYYRERGQNETAMMWAEAGARIPYPSDDLLFVDEGVYRYAFAHETSIAGYYCKDPARRRAAHVATLELQLRRDVPADVRDLARRNGRYYATAAEVLFVRRRLVRIDPPMPATFTPTNPSVFLDGDTLAVVVRGVNYRLGDPARGWPPVIRTHNVLARLDGDGRIVEARDMRAAPSLPAALETAVAGYEDCRLFRWRGRLHCSATVRDRHPSMRCEIALIGLDDDARIDSLDLLHGHGDDRHQKNWMPAADGDELYFVYGCDPTTVLRYDAVERAVRVHGTHVPSLALDHLRGGTQLVRDGDGWLCLTHEVVPLGGWERRYLHRFVRFDATFRIVAITEPFRLGDEPIEFAAGLATGGGDVLHVSYGIADREAWLATFDAGSVRRALVALP